jgi:hypothetical protein
MEIPALAKVGSASFLALIAAVYWRAYGPGNFLWLSDIGLACTVVAIVLESSLLASMAAVGVLVPELAWTVDFLAKGRLLGLAAYMFDSRLPLYLRGLSLFHLAVPPILIVLLYRYGYDDRALIWQTLVTLVALALSYALTAPTENVNWVFGPGREPQQMLPPLLYLGLEMVAISALVLLPTHFLLQWMFPGPALGSR